jgi:hypothetical protein
MRDASGNSSVHASVHASTHASIHVNIHARQDIHARRSELLATALAAT